MSDGDAMALIRDGLSALRQDVGRVFDRLDDAVTSNQALHRDIDTRLSKLESPPAAKYAWVPTAAKVLWPAAVVLMVLLRDATPDTKRQVTNIVTTAAGLPDVKSGASVHPEHTNSTYTVKSWGGPK